MWTTQTQTQTLINTCVGSKLTFAWFFTLDTGERVEDIKWLYTPGGTGTSTMIASYGAGTFMAFPSVAQRLHHLGNGSIELSHVTLSDSGHYTIEVILTKGGVFSSVRRTAVVHVAGTSIFDSLFLCLIYLRECTYIICFVKHLNQ